MRLWSKVKTYLRKKTLLHFQTDRHKMCNLITSPLFCWCCYKYSWWIFPFDLSDCLTFSTMAINMCLLIYDFCLSFLGKIIVILTKAKYHEWARHAHQKTGWTLKYEKVLRRLTYFRFFKKVSWCYQKHDWRLQSKSARTICYEAEY